MTDKLHVFDDIPEFTQLREALETVLSLFDDPCPYDTATTLAAARAVLRDSERPEVE